MADVDTQPVVNGEVDTQADGKPSSEATQASTPPLQTAEVASPFPDAPSSTPVPPAPPSLTTDELELLTALASGQDPSKLPSWEDDLRPLMLKQLSYNLHQFLVNPPPRPGPRPDIPSTTFGVVFRKFPERGPPSPRSTTLRLPTMLEGEELKREEDKVREMLDEFDEGPPFTIQRLAELLLYPFREHRMVGKYLRAVQRVLSVTPSFDPGAYAPIPAPPSEPSSGAPATATPAPATPFSLASTPMFSPIVFLQGKELPTPSPRKSASPPMSPLDIGPRRSPNPSPRGSPRIAARRGGPRVATSSAAMSAQTRRRANSQSSPSSPTVPSAGPSTRPPPPAVPEAFPQTLRPPPPAPSTSQPRSPTPPPTSPPMGPTPTRVDELDNPDAHKSLLDEPVALSSVTTGKVKIKSPEMRPADMPAILGVLQGAGSPPALEPVPGLGLSLGERFVPATTSAVASPGAAGEEPEKATEEDEKDKAEDDKDGEGNGSNGSGEGDEGEVERMVSEEREMEDVAVEGAPVASTSTTGGAGAVAEEDVVMDEAE